MRGYNPESGKLKFMIRDVHNRGVTALAPFSTGKLLITGGGEGQVGGEGRVWGEGQVWGEGRVWSERDGYGAKDRYGTRCRYGVRGRHLWNVDSGGGWRRELVGARMGQAWGGVAQWRRNVHVLYKLRSPDGKYQAGQMCS